MYKIDEFNKCDLLFLLECRGLVPYIVYDNLMIYRGNDIIFSKDKNKLDVTDLNKIFGFDFVDSKYIYYLIEIACENDFKCKRKSLRL